ncbi:site-specific integrase [Priestia megaterium]|uniref:tyrosine-type recombinase/integrase n=1 Tax=Priestia megaterium TaxID=1404 RepID=UPI003000B4CB
MTLAPVFPINDNQSKIFKVYNSLLASSQRNSERTADEYKRRIEEFFQIILKKHIAFVTMEDLDGIEYSDVKFYVSELTKRGNVDKTISTKLNSVRSFYNELLKNKIQVNPMILKVSLKIEEKHHQALSFEELDMLYEFMLNEKELALQKYLLVKTLFTTGNRITATLNMTWKDDFIQRRDVVTGQSVWIVNAIDKGKKRKEKPIPDEFYEELQQLNNGQDKVFTMSKKTIERALDRFGKEIGREVTPHCLKATGVTHGFILTKNIELCRQYASHENISTTGKYLNEEQSYVNQLSYNMSRELDESKLLNMSHEDLLEFIMNNDNKDIKNSILLRLG